MAAGNEIAALKEFSKSIDITPQMAHTFILALRHLNIEYYVAPYEADAQLAFMYLSNRVDFILTEDSDLLAFGVQKALFKLDHAGVG